MAPTVLIVDDCPNIRRLVRQVLELEGYTVAGEAEHGGPALDQMRASQEPLLVLLGLMMPVVDGEQVLEEVAADGSLAARHRIIVLTGSIGWATAGRVAEPRQQLDAPLVPKPFTVPQLLRAIEDVMTSMAQRQLDG